MFSEVIIFKKLGIAYFKTFLGMCFARALMGENLRIFCDFYQTILAEY